MSNDSNISHSFTAPPPEAAPALYAFANCEIIPVDNTMALVSNRDNGKQQMIAPQVVDALKTCTTFRTLEDHADQLARSRPELKSTAVEATEAELVGEFRRLARGWAATLEAWPAVREACQRMAWAS